MTSQGERRSQKSYTQELKMIKLICFQKPDKLLGLAKTIMSSKRLRNN